MPRIDVAPADSVTLTDDRTIVLSESARMEWCVTGLSTSHPTVMQRLWLPDGTVVAAAFSAPYFIISMTALTDKYWNRKEPIDLKTLRVYAEVIAPEKLERLDREVEALYRKEFPGLVTEVPDVRD